MREPFATRPSKLAHEEDCLGVCAQPSCITRSGRTREQISRGRPVQRAYLRIAPAGEARIGAPRRADDPERNDAAAQGLYRDRRPGWNFVPRSQPIHGLCRPRDAGLNHRSRSQQAGSEAGWSIRDYDARNRSGKCRGRGEARADQRCAGRTREGGASTRGSGGLEVLLRLFVPGNRDDERRLRANRATAMGKSTHLSSSQYCRGAGGLIPLSEPQMVRWSRWLYWRWELEWLGEP